MTFPKTVLAYLTGWVIVQPIYNRLFAAWKRRELASPSSSTRAYFHEQARAFVDELHHYSPGQPPVALDVIVALHTELERLRPAARETVLMGDELLALIASEYDALDRRQDVIEFSTALGYLRDALS